MEETGKKKETRAARWAREFEKLRDSAMVEFDPGYAKVLPPGDRFLICGKQIGFKGAVALKDFLAYWTEEVGVDAEFAVGIPIRMFRWMPYIAGIYTPCIDGKRNPHYWVNTKPVEEMMIESRAGKGNGGLHDSLDDAMSAVEYRIQSNWSDWLDGAEEAWG